MRRLSTFLTEHRVLAWCFIVLFAIPPGLGFYGFRIAKPVRQQWASQSDRELLKEGRNRHIARHFERLRVRHLPGDRG